MGEDTKKRAERLVTFRKLQRERASMAVHCARAAAETAEEAVFAQEKQLNDEARIAQPEDQRPKSPDEIQLALAVVEAMRAELQHKAALLKNARKDLGDKSKALLATHKRVRQMEALRAAADRERQREARRQEQSEIDDLAVNKEARR